MWIVLSFAPFIAFAVLMRLVSVEVGLLAAAGISLVQILLRYRRGDAIKVLEVGSVALFVGLAGYTVVLHPAWSVAGIRLVVDIGLLAIVLVSIAVARPFTLAYARERAPPEVWNEPRFIAANYVISWVWAAAFGVMVLADLAMVFVPTVPLWLDITATVLALVVAVNFTIRYPRRVRARITA